MQVNPFLDARLAGGPKTAASNPRRIEKSSASSGLGAQHRDDPHARSQTPPRLQVELVCQDETARHDPFRDAPRLMPTFVTQLLGQVMAERRENVSVATAYGNVTPRQAIFFDRKS
jgi:hypothetical protein